MIHFLWKLKLFMRSVGMFGSSCQALFTFALECFLLKSSSYGFIVSDFWTTTETKESKKFLGPVIVEVKKAPVLVYYCHYIVHPTFQPGSWITKRLRKTLPKIDKYHEGMLGPPFYFHWAEVSRSSHWSLINALSLKRCCSLYSRIHFRESFRFFQKIMTNQSATIR